MPLMSYLTDGAQDHLRMMDAKPYEYDHKCNGCGEGFDRGHGVKITEEYFCNPCIDAFRHFDFYRECGLSDGEIWNLVENNLIGL